MRALFVGNQTDKNNMVLVWRQDSLVKCLTLFVSTVEKKRTPSVQKKEKIFILFFMGVMNVSEIWNVQYRCTIHGAEKAVEWTEKNMKKVFKNLNNWEMYEIKKPLSSFYFGLSAL